jgi:MFS superfamily sulfate permease-like transporter
MDMPVHRLLGNSVNPPFWTAILFLIPVAALSGAESWAKPWPKRAVVAIIVGTVLGWFFYAEVVTTP